MRAIRQFWREVRDSSGLSRLVYYYMGAGMLLAWMLLAVDIYGRIALAIALGLGLVGDALRAWRSGSFEPIGLITLPLGLILGLVPLLIWALLKAPLA